MKLIDTIAHLDFTEFAEDRESVISRAVSAGISDIIIPSVTQKNWSAVEEVCNQYTQCHPAYGLHPLFTKQHTTTHLDELALRLKEPSTIALGECGLDFYDNRETESEQHNYFDAQLEMAISANLPVIIHSRKSIDDICKLLKSKQGNIKGMIHSFSGSYQQAKNCIDLGLYLSFGGPFTHERSNRLRKLITQLPLENLLIETDSPDQPAANYAKQRNEPAYLVDIATQMAGLKKLDIETVADSTYKNAKALFDI